MNTQIHRKQIIILILSMMLAIVSYWIPLPSRYQGLNPDSPEMATRPVPVESVTFAREPVTAWRFPVTVRIPQTTAPTDNSVTLPDSSAQPVKHMINLWELSNGEGSHLNKSRLMPIMDQTHDPAR
ncbi:hypothetical protein [Candidatus Contendibacter odensensis]|uniref:Uncharacterized protein n=1 Tax=Candidatus Contendobacter odensis Run_B_J11 TaxID=1400861 RepID=A0A7U7J5Q8_9GAMM|nr:hypothetical protein [Candidatus Contendobacter odensis]CDH47092.1 hypothetical protein BN874_720036 [Candidatus Contendobacter odensis Run_B_J11]